MKDNMDFQQVVKKYLFITLLMLWAAFLLFKGLGFAPLWDDESSTAWYARNIVHTGIPTAWDGKNLFAPLEGVELNDSLVLAYIPWLPYYLAAGSFALFGDSALAVRLPFALIGLASVFFFYAFLRKAFSDQKMVYFGSLLYVQTLPFLIYSRQCRYFALLIFFPVMWLWIMTHLENKKRILGLSILFTLFLHTHYFVAACFVIGLFFAGLFTRAANKNWKEHFIALASASVFFLPWFYFYNPWRTAFENILVRKNDSPFLRISFYLYELNFNLIFPFLLLCLLPFAWKAAHTLRRKQILAGIVFFVTFLFSIFYFDTTKVVSVRYVVSLIPLAVFLWIICLEQLFHNTILQTCMLALIMFTDIASLPMLTKQTFFLKNRGDKIFYQPKAIAFQRFPFLGYWNSIMHDFPRAYDVAAEMIRKHVPKGACVTTYPDYHRRPLMYLLSQDYDFCSQMLPKSQGRWGKIAGLPLRESIFAVPKTIEAWVVVFGDEGSGRGPNYNELAPDTPGVQLIDVANWDCTAGSRPEFSVFQTHELPVPPGDPRAIRLMHYIPPAN